MLMTAYGALFVVLASAPPSGGSARRMQAKLAKTLCMHRGDKLLQVNGVDADPAHDTPKDLYTRYRCAEKLDVVVRRLGAASAYTCKPPPCAEVAQVEQP